MIGQDAINRDPAWFAEHVKKTPKGAPLAYDPRLGVTEEEYARFRRVKDVMTLRPSGPVTIKISLGGTRRSTRSVEIPAQAGIQ